MYNYISLTSGSNFYHLNYKEHQWLRVVPKNTLIYVVLMSREGKNKNNVDTNVFKLLALTQTKKKKKWLLLN